MRKIVILGLLASLSLTPAMPALAETGSATNNSSEAQSQANAGRNADNRQICVREATSESRLRRTVCHTAREWRDLQANDDHD